MFMQGSIKKNDDARQANAPNTAIQMTLPSTPRLEPKSPALTQQAADIWVLLTSKQGDNNQLIALADALGRPYRTFKLRFRSVRSMLPPTLLGPTLASLSHPLDLPAGGQWPRAVLASGRRSVPVARWIRQQSGEQARLIHLGRPWSPLQGFDLVVTTPQYGLPQGPNVLQNLLPFVSAKTSSQAVPLAAEWDSLAQLPRPWTVVLLGGHSRPYVFDLGVAAGLAESVNEQIRTHGGSALLIGSPRTPKNCIDLIEKTIDVPHQLYRWNQGRNPYPVLRHQADRFVVTGDSAAMVSEALLTAKPVELFELPCRPDWRWRLVAAWRAAGHHVALLRRAYEQLRNSGLLSSTRDVGEFHRQLRQAGLFDDPRRVPLFALREQRRTVRRVLAAIDGGAAVES